MKTKKIFVLKFIEDGYIKFALRFRMKEVDLDRFRTPESGSTQTVHHLGRLTFGAEDMTILFVQRPHDSTYESSQEFASYHKEEALRAIRKAYKVIGQSSLEPRMITFAFNHEYSAVTRLLFGPDDGEIAWDQQRLYMPLKEEEIHWFFGLLEYLKA